jgi:hypothetical protein
MPLSRWLRACSFMGGLVVALPGVAEAAPCEGIECSDEEAAVEDAGANDAAAADTSAPRSVNVSGLVPLKELNQRPYSKAWLGDLRFHAMDIGLSVTSLSVSGNVAGSFFDGTAQRATLEQIDGRLTYGGVWAGYYQPLFGYTPNFSVGLFPAIHLGLGASYSGNSSSALSGLRDGGTLGKLLRIPVFATARLGGRASRYADWDLSFGAGVGVELVSFSTGEPVSASSTYLAPVARVEAAYGFVHVFAEAGLTAHDDFASPQDAVRLSYQQKSIGLGLLFKAAPDD